MLADTILASRPLVYLRGREVVVSSAVIRDAIRTLDLAFPSSTTITNGLLDLPCYGDDPPSCFVFPTAQAAAARISGLSATALATLGSASGDCTMAGFFTAPATPSDPFPPALCLGGNISDCMALYLLQSQRRMDTVYRTGGADTGTGSGTGFTVPDDELFMPALRYSGSTGMQVNCNGVDYGTRANPTTKWTTLGSNARFTPGNRAANRNWEGKGGEFVLWDRDVPAAELLGIWNASQAEPSGGTGEISELYELTAPGVWTLID
jgi:hypothetical protein